MIKTKIYQPLTGCEILFLINNPHLNETYFNHGLIYKMPYKV
jgi:hypothetical protein